MKNTWKPLSVEADMLSSKDLECFTNVEELKDYVIIKEDHKDKKGEKRKKKNKSKDIKKKAKASLPANQVTPNISKAEKIDMSAWANCFLPEPVERALEDLGFHTPTKIQEFCIPAALRDHRDILGAAETGSGKTLAFGIPVVSSILAMKERNRNVEDAEDSDSSKPLYSLILAPTRELACQIKQHLQAICKYTDIMIAQVLGGMAPEKQRRILKKKPDIVVATPGRLWELIEEGEPHLNQIAFIKHLVIDEADRMLEKGHFQELTQILNLINGNKNNKRQNLVFSATLTFVHETPKRLILKKKKEKLHQKLKLDSLVSAIGVKNHKVIDLTKKIVVETLTESQISCSLKDKDLYLYYFITVHPGRTIVFSNSIDCVRRLRTVLEYLNCNPLPLHASMHQKQRLKNLEKFASSNNAVLLATDVAARGLDIRGVQHVIHYQVPRTVETYVHRSGRTARAQNEGLSLMLIDPQEAVFYKRICKTLNKDKALPAFNVNFRMLTDFKKRVQLAQNIDKMKHKTKRINSNNNWFLNAAKEADIELDENLLRDAGSSDEKKRLQSMKRELDRMISVPPLKRRKHL